MVKPPTLYTFEKFLADQGDEPPKSPEKEMGETVTNKSEAQLQLFLQAIEFLVMGCRLYKSAVMRAIEIPNQQLHIHFAVGKKVPLEELEQIAKAFGITLPELLTLPDWYPRRTKYRNHMLMHLAREKLIPKKRV